MCVLVRYFMMSHIKNMKNWLLSLASVLWPSTLAAVMKVCIGNKNSGCNAGTGELA